MNEHTDEFIRSVSHGFGMFFASAEVSESEQSRSQTESIQRGMRNAAMWLTEGALRGYDKADFSDLPATARDTIQICVGRLRGLIARFPPDQGPPAAIFDEAAPVFSELVAVLTSFYPQAARLMRKSSDEPGA